MTPLDCAYGSSWEEAAWAKTNAPNGCAPISSKSDARRVRAAPRLDRAFRETQQSSTLGHPRIHIRLISRCRLPRGPQPAALRLLTPRPRQEPAHHLGGVVDHRDDACVVEPGRADHAEHPDDAAGAVAIGRDDGGGTGEREQLVLRADEDAHPLGALGAAEDVDQAALGFEIVEQ